MTKFDMAREKKNPYKIFITNYVVMVAVFIKKLLKNYFKAS